MDSPRAILYCNLQYKIDVFCFVSLSLEDAEEKLFKASVGPFGPEKGRKNRPISALRLARGLSFLVFCGLLCKNVL